MEGPFFEGCGLGTDLVHGCPVCERFSLWRVQSVKDAIYKVLRLLGSVFGGSLCMQLCPVGFQSA